MVSAIGAERPFVLAEGKDHLAHLKSDTLLAGVWTAYGVCASTPFTVHANTLL